jgi:hypothetical protein
MGLWPSAASALKSRRLVALGAACRALRTDALGLREQWRVRDSGPVQPHESTGAREGAEGEGGGRRQREKGREAGRY